MSYYTATLYASSILRLVDVIFGCERAKYGKIPACAFCPQFRKTVSQQDNNATKQQDSKNGPHKTTL